jgi:hypothetical protein
LVALLALAAPVWAGPLEDGVAAYQRNDFVTALSLWRPLAEQGDAMAQGKLGLMYDLGRGVPQNYAEAVKWYRKAAEQGHAVPQTLLGYMYREGRGVPQDYAEAIKWYRKAAEQGNDFAQRFLGVMYEQGEGVPQNYAEAVMWYRRAAGQGYALAQFALGMMYDAGRGVPQDYVQAHAWYNLGASRFSASEKKERDVAVKSRDEVASKMTPAQIAEAQRLAREWKPAVGPPLPGEGLQLEDVGTSSAVQEGVSVILVEGRIRNISTAPRLVPALLGTLRDEQKRDLQSWTFTVPSPHLAPGEAVTFRTEVRRPSTPVAEMSITFQAN